MKIKCAINMHKTLTKQRRAVSHVIAAILLIGVTVMAMAVLSFIVIGLLDTGEAIPYYVTLEQVYDYNNDDRIDGLVLDVQNVHASKEGTISHLTLDRWELAPGYSNTVIAAGDTRQIMIITQYTSAQLSPDDELTLALSSSSEGGQEQQLDLKNPTVPDPVTVTVQAGDEPVVGIKISFETEDGLPVSFPPTPTDSNGQIEAYLMPAWFKAKTETGLYSELFHRVDDTSVTIQSEPIISESINVKVMDGDNNPISDIRVYDTDLEQRDLGQSQVTNASGMVTFVELEGEYLFRARYLEEDYWSSSVVVPGSDDITTTIVIGSDALVGKVLMGGEPAGQSKLIRLYTYPNNNYMGYDYTNSSSYFEFTGIPAGLYRLRLDYQSSYYWSRIVSTSDPNLEVDFGGGTLEIQVLAGNDPLPNGVLIRLLRGDTGKYTGRYDYLNSSGWAVYPTTPSANYSLRIDWLSQYIYTDTFYHDGTPLQVSVDGGNLNVHVMAGDTPLPKGVLIRLFNSQEKYTGRYDYTNGTGWAEYGAIPGGNYSVRVDWLSNYYHTEEFVHNGTSVSVDIGGGSLNVQVMAGDTPMPNGVLIRLMRGDTGKYTGRYDYTNGSGFAEFGAIPAGNYSVRVDWLSNYYYTDSFWHNGTTQTVNIGGGSLNVQVMAGDTPMPNGVLIRLMRGDTGKYTGRYDYTNGSGFAEFGAIPAGNYSVRVDWLSNYYYTDSFWHNGTTQTVDIGGGGLNVQILASTDPFPNGVLIRLMRGDTSKYTGRYDYTNGSGFAEFGAIPAGNYSIRADWLSNYYYSDSFIHDGSPQAVDLGGGIMNIQITADGQALPGGVLIRLLRGDTSKYTGRYDYTNGSGFAEFGAIPAGNYSIRADWLGTYFYSDSFIHDGTTQNLDLGGGLLTFEVRENGALVGSGVYTQLFLASGKYCGRYDYTNSTSHAWYGPIPETEYQLRVRIGGEYYYSQIFTHNSSSTVLVDIDTT